MQPSPRKSAHVFKEKQAYWHIVGTNSKFPVQKAHDWELILHNFQNRTMMNSGVYPKITRNNSLRMVELIVCLELGYGPINQKSSSIPKKLDVYDR